MMGAIPLRVGKILGSDLVVNGGFETAGAGGADVFGTWTEFFGTGNIEADAVKFNSGTKSAKLTSGATTNNYINTPNIAVTPGQIYRIRYYGAGNDVISGRYSLYDVTNSAFIKSGIVSRLVSSTFQEKDILFVAPVGCVNIRIFLLAAQADTAVINIDDVSMYVWQYPYRFYDDFNRADGDPNKSASGYPYELQYTGTSGNLVISNNDLVMPNTDTGYSYAYVDLPRMPKSISATFSWLDDNIEKGDPVVMSASNDRNNFASYKNFIHFYVTTTEWVLQWVNATGTFTTLGTAEIVLLPATQYTATLTVSGNTAYIDITGIPRITITDANIGTYFGQYIFYELLRTNADRKTSKIHSVLAIY